MAGHEWDDWFEREEFIGQISDIRVQNLQVEREVVQKRTFTRWMNLHLEKCNPPMEVRDLFRDIQDGRILMALLEELSGCKLLHGFKPSSHRIFRLNNIAKVLTFLEERNVKLVSIDAADVADGNSSIVLGLIWNIILFFQIKELTGNIKTQFPSSSSLSSLPNSSDSDTSHSSTPSDERRPSIALRDHGKAIKTLLQWVQRRTRKYGVAVQDFGKSWTSGLAFLAVIKSIDSSLVDMRRALLRSARENIEDAFRTAHYSLGIPRLLEPEDVTINPDEQSIMTYVSQFLEHFPGFDEEEVPNVIERSMLSSKVSSRLNDRPVNGVHRKREKPYVVRKDWVQPPPKIFISSVSDDSEQPSPSPLQSPGDGPGEEDSSESISSSASGPPKRPLDLGKEVSFTVSSSSSPQPSFVDSVIDSPDSWSEMPSEAVPPEKLPESRSDGSLNESDLPLDRTDWQPEKPSAGDGGSPAETGKATEDQVFSELFIDEGNFSQSSAESFQAQSKLPSEEEDAFRYILDLSEEGAAEHSLSGNCDQLEEKPNKADSCSEEMEQSSMAQSIDDKQSCPELVEEPERTDILHKVESSPQCLLEEKNLSLSQNNDVKQLSSEPSAETEQNYTPDKRLEHSLEHKDTSPSQNQDNAKKSFSELLEEPHKIIVLTDTHCEPEFGEEQPESAGMESDEISQPSPKICMELDQTIPSTEVQNEPESSLGQGESRMQQNDFEDERHADSEQPQDCTDSAVSDVTEAEIQSPVKEEASDAQDDTQTNKVAADNDTCAPSNGTLENVQPCKMSIDAPEASPPEEVNGKALDSATASDICEMNDGTHNIDNPSETNTVSLDEPGEKNGGTSEKDLSGESNNHTPSCEQPRDKDFSVLEESKQSGVLSVLPRDTVHKPPCTVLPTVMEECTAPSPETVDDEGNVHCPPSPTVPQTCPTEADPEGSAEQSGEHHTHLPETEHSIGGDGINDAAEEADQKSSSAEPESVPVGPRNFDSVSELKPVPFEERALDSKADSKERLAENSEDSRQYKEEQGGKEGQPRSQMAPSNECQREDDRDSGATELDTPGEHCELIKADEDPAAASENTGTLRRQADDDDSANESHSSPALHLRRVMESDGLKNESGKISESERSHYISPDLRSECKAPATCSVTAAEIYWLLLLWIILYCLFVLPQLDIKTLPHLLLNLEE
ncbi:calmin [Megalops cyprinoides]|uniref:calmin n=1 Tax=Megalops cyprinoides TaxID=118141 RepID=UPI0018645718|nr:calmin [Megalops cyprinoides]